MPIYHRVAHGFTTFNGLVINQSVKPCKTVSDPAVTQCLIVKLCKSDEITCFMTNSRVFLSKCANVTLLRTLGRYTHQNDLGVYPVYGHFVTFRPETKPLLTVLTVSLVTFRPETKPLLTVLTAVLVTLRHG